MGISSLYFTDVGPFDEITLEFDDQVNVFTGPNNSGKSTVLWVLNQSQGGMCIWLVMGTWIGVTQELLCP